MSSDDNGFLERPTRHGNTGRPGARKPNSMMGRLRATAENGKAVPVKWQSGQYTTILKRQGYRLRSGRTPDGILVAWCERIAPEPAP